MADSPGKSFKQFAAEFREHLGKRSQHAVNDESVGDIIGEDERSELGERDPLPQPDTSQSPAPSDSELYYFDELVGAKRVRVSVTHITFGKFTYALRFLASVERKDRNPPMLLSYAAVLIIGIAVVAAMYYGISGKLGSGVWPFTVIAGMVALFFLGIYWLKSMKARYSLIFRDQPGETIKKVETSNRAQILRLEATVKKVMGVKP
ncbi:MAG TPA: hypothetical protein DD979_10770 [Gammaproteobacteria bacterium]|nr:hypothetical protein [Gammaproteobacteria bacterium]